MFCDEVLDAIEPIAAGELTPDGRIAAHLTSCPNCAAALDTARRLEQMLRTRSAPKAPAQFTTRTLTAVRRQRWRSEQFVDTGFNIALAVIAFGVIATIWILLNRSGLVNVGNGALTEVGAAIRTVTPRVSRSVSLYAGAMALLVTGIAIWWWAERDARA